MNFKRLLYILPFFLAITVSPKISFAGHESPTIFVKNMVDECISILRSDKSKDIQKEKILNLIKISFDFPSITENLLTGLKVNDKDKSALTDLFPYLLEMRYGIFIKSPNNLSVEYNGHELFFFDFEAVVHTRTKVSSHSIALDYKLRHVDGKWKIRDLEADGVSLVSNYRAQINKILTRMSFPDFIKHLEEIVGKKTDPINGQQS
ncbi:MAG: ABC transporter substrate-binding protein [Candidatus Azambacteria bacterium]|nr:ABC transporter substrate-binding protein [Candidatus Azambacteria bacterium]